MATSKVSHGLAVPAKVLLGGTFDPVHQGHVALALELSRYLTPVNGPSQEVHLLPNSQPAHRQAPHGSAKQRAAMLALAIAEHAQLVLDERELRRHGPSYSVLTLAELRAEVGPQAPLIWCLGVDAFAGLKQWHRWQELLDYGHLLVLSRPAAQWPMDAELLAWYAMHKVDAANVLLASPCGQVAHLKLGQYAVSATQLRQQMRLGQQPSATELAPAVTQYIASQSLYGLKP